LGRGVIAGSGVRDDLMAEVRKRWPCQELPWGAMTELALKYGISRERVRQIVRGKGMYEVRPPTRKSKTKGCHDCGSHEVEPGAHHCEDHRWVVMQCPSCGNDFKMTRVEAIARGSRSNGSSKGAGSLFVCRRTCRKERGLAWLAENPGATQAEVAEYAGVSPSAVWTWLNKK